MNNKTTHQAPQLKRELLVIKNELNDNGSDLYVNQIRKQWKESYQDDINLIIYNVDSQETFEEVLLQHSNSKVLLVEPTNLVLPSYLQHRNAEQHQTAMYVSNVVQSIYSKLETKVLIVGKGNVGKKIFDELCLQNGYCVTMYGSEFIMDDDFSEQFDVVINATSQDALVEMYVDCDMLLDISGNFVEYGRPKWIEHNGEDRLVELPCLINTKYTMREIGRATTWMMLEQIKNGGK